MDVVPGCGFLRPVPGTVNEHQVCINEAIASIEYAAGIFIPSCAEHAEGRVTVGNWGKPEHDHHVAATAEAATPASSRLTAEPGVA